MGAGAARGGLPAARYAAVAGLFAVAFVALAMADEWAIFRDAWFSPPRGPERSESAPEAERAVRALAAAIDRAYRGGPAALDAAPAGAALLADLRAEIAFARRPGAGTPEGLRRLDVLAARPEPGGAWRVATEETWAFGGADSRLRFSYRVAPDGADLRVEEATPVLPEPHADAIP